MIGVFGADGFLGRHLVRRLATAGKPLRAVGRRFATDSPLPHLARVSTMQADLHDAPSMAAALDDVHTVVNLISTSSPAMGNDSMIDDLRENVVPQVRFLELCVRAGVRRVVFVSSGGTVYGPSAPVPTPETAPTAPINSHGLTKLVIEKYLGMHGHVDGLDHVILRLANPFGPGQSYRKGQGLIPLILARHDSGLPVQIFGDGSAARDYVYIDDAIAALVAAIELPGHPRLAINVGSGRARSVLEVIAAIEEATGDSVAVTYAAARGTDVAISQLDISLAREVLGWQPCMSFHAGIRETVEAWRTSKNGVQ